MGDRNNPIKFGPEWLRNLAREPSATGSGSNNHNTTPAGPNNTAGPAGTGTGATARPNSRNMTGRNTPVMAGSNFGSMAASGPIGPSAGPSGMANPSNVSRSSTGGLAVPGPSGMTQRNKYNNNVPKVLLAKLRYGREEMLALYDKSAESPDELKQFDILYQPRSKPPFALNDTFEEESRDAARSGSVAGTAPPPVRYSVSRGGGVGRVGNVAEPRGKSRMPFVRQTQLGRGGNSWHARMPSYNTGPEEDATLRPWNSSNGGVPANRTTSEPPEWTNNKMFRSRRQNNNTNWRRSHGRDENDEWRAQDSSRSRPPVEKWDREWGDRPNPERQQSWNSNRRTWVGNEMQNNDESLPEWAVDSAEAGAGSFDSSGAFHGYSNDDSNLPKSRETSFPLARSHTHGSFVHSKTAEEGSDEWWASEKAKKLSAKKFETGDTKFIQPGAFGAPEGSGSHSTSSANRDVKDEDLGDEIETPKEENSERLESPVGNDSNGEDSNQAIMFSNQYQDNNQYENLLRPEMGLEYGMDERSNFQSVMIPPNDGLRQKHQNLVAEAMNPNGRHRNTGLLQMIHGMPRYPTPETENHDPNDETLVEKILDMTLGESKLQTPMMSSMHPNCINPRMPTHMPNSTLQMQMGVNPGMSTQNLAMKSQSTLQMAGYPPHMQQMQNVGMPNQMNPPIQNVGIHNPVLNSLGMPMGSNNNGLVLPMQGVPPPVIPNNGMQARLGFQPAGGMQMMQGAHVANPSIFMQPNNPPPMPANEIPMPPNANAQANMYPPMHPMQRSNSQGPFGSIFNHPPPITPDANLVDAWYYEDPEKIIQGPFSSKEMYNWYKVGFFSPSLMVRRACESHLRPLGSYGPVVPFVQMDSLWTQPSATDLIWMQQMNQRNESRVNNLPLFFWESQGGSAISSNSLMPEEITKGMKTEDQILAQLRASQNIPTPQSTSFMNDQPSTSSATPSASINQSEESFPTNVSATPNLEELQKLIQPENLTHPVTFPVAEPEREKSDETEEPEVKEKPPKEEPSPAEVAPTAETPPVVVAKQQQPSTKPVETKPTKQSKTEAEKGAKKENNATKGKSKKTKEEKKEEVPEVKTKEDVVPIKPEKRSVESSPTKNKKEDKQSKKEQDKEKKELVKDGFTIVKGADKSTNKENKKKAEEAKALAAAAEEAEKKKKEEEKLAIEEEKKRKIADAIKKAQEQQQQRQECIPKKAPWSSVPAQAVATNKDGMTLAEIQRLEREKKVEQIKEQQQMMQIIAQQQAAAIAREQEMQAGLGWAKKKASNVNVSGHSLAEIQAETRKAAAAAAAAAAATAAAAAAQALDDSPPPSAVHVPWVNSHNGGFWETQPTPPKVEKAGEGSKSAENSKSKKKVSVNNKKESTPTVEFEAWCTTTLTSWSSKIDVPTFIGFLKDIESPYEVKDYVKCYLGDTKESGDFARQFLERRSKLLRVGMVTPSDDLCSPAMAINPRNSNLGDYQEVKGKGKKTKKNKMLKVDARILGFSVTAAEDRINVGDIDTV